MRENTHGFFSIKYVIIVIAIPLAIILIVGLFFLLKAPKIAEEAYGENYIIEGVEIPTIATVINGNRKVTKMFIGTSKIQPYKSFTYSNVMSIKSDVKSYIEYLIKVEDFELEFEENPDSVLWKAILSKYNNGIKKNIVVKIECDVNNYTIAIKTTEGKEK